MGVDFLFNSPTMSIFWSTHQDLWIHLNLWWQRQANKIFNFSSSHKLFHPFMELITWQCCSNSWVYSPQSVKKLSYSTPIIMENIGLHSLIHFELNNKNNLILYPFRSKKKQKHMIYCCLPWIYHYPSYPRIPFIDAKTCYCPYNNKNNNSNLLFSQQQTTEDHGLSKEIGIISGDIVIKEFIMARQPE